MICKELNQLQAFIDGELSREERKHLSHHLEECSECRNTIQEMKKMNQWIEARLKNTIPELDVTEPVHTDKAWHRFQNIVQQNETGKEGIAKEKSWNWRPTMTKNRKRRIITAASVAMLCTSLMIPQVQSLASEFLSIFRLNRVEFVKITQDDIQKVRDALSSDKNGTLDLKELGSLRTEVKGKYQYFPTLKEAQKAGIALPQYPSGFTVKDISKSSIRKISIQLNTEKVNLLLKQLNVNDVHLSDNINNKTITLVTPEEIGFNLEKNGDGYHYSEFSAPIIEVESGVDVNEIRNLLLALPFIPDSIKQKLINLNDWQHTLLFPIYEQKQGKEKVKECTIHGSKGIIIENRYSTELIWQNNEKISIINNLNGTKKGLQELASEIK